MLAKRQDENAINEIRSKNREIIQFAVCSAILIKKWLAVLKFIN